MKTVLTIAGSDPSGGAGIQADIKTITAHKLYAMSAITALTVQNTQGVYNIHEIQLTFFDEQLCAVLSDIKPDAVKIGMLGNPEIVHVIAKRLKEYEVKNIVLDPVMVSTSGCRLMENTTLQALQRELFPIASILTPNLPEASILANMNMKTVEDMEQAALTIHKQFPGAILIKGGHLDNHANDVLLWEDTLHWFKDEHIDNENTHGTGCTLSSAIACGLAQGKSVIDSVQEAKSYIHDCICAQLNLGKGKGPIQHTCRLK